MKAILKFKLPKEQEEFKFATSAGIGRSVLQDFDNWLRGLIKHSNRDDLDTLGEVRSKLHTVATDHNLLIWE